MILLKESTNVIPNYHKNDHTLKVIKRMACNITIKIESEMVI